MKEVLGLLELAKTKGGLKLDSTNALCLTESDQIVLIKDPIEKPDIQVDDVQLMYVNEGAVYNPM